MSTTISHPLTHSPLLSVMSVMLGAATLIDIIPTFRGRLENSTVRNFLPQTFFETFGSLHNKSNKHKFRVHFLYKVNYSKSLFTAYFKPLKRGSYQFLACPVCVFIGYHYHPTSCNDRNKKGNWTSRSGFSSDRLTLVVSYFLEEMRS